MLSSLSRVRTSQLLLLNLTRVVVIILSSQVAKLASRASPILRLSNLKVAITLGLMSSLLHNKILVTELIKINNVAFTLRLIDRFKSIFRLLKA